MLKSLCERWPVGEPPPLQITKVSYRTTPEMPRMMMAHARFSIKIELFSVHSRCRRERDRYVTPATVLEIKDEHRVPQSSRRSLSRSVIVSRVGLSSPLDLSNSNAQTTDRPVPRSIHRNQPTIPPHAPPTVVVRVSDRSQLIPVDLTL